MKKFIFSLILLLGTLMSFAQSKVIINDFTRLKKELISIKSEAETYASEMKNTWKSDTEKAKGKGMYIQLSAAVDGIIDQFQTVIRRPKMVNDDLKGDINSDLEKIKTKLTAFNEYYVGGNLAPGDSSINETSILALFEVGKGFISEFKKILNHQREEMALEFAKDCKLRKWEEL